MPWKPGFGDLSEWQAADWSSLHPWSASRATGIGTGKREGPLPAPLQGQFSCPGS